MDAFYASVEAHDDPALMGRPLIVGGTGARGVVASCSYEARTFGVRSAMPAGRARRLCPQAVFLAGRFDRYREVSSQLHGIFEHYTPLVEGISLDEAFLDVSGAIRLFGPPATMAAEIRRRVADELGLACSVGVAPSKFLAKLASQAAKPVTSRDPAQPGPRPGPGVVEVVAGDELGFLHPMPVQALWGVGPATLVRLGRLGVSTVADLAAIPLTALELAVGRAQGRHLHALAQARDDRPVVADRPPKSIGHEETYAVDRSGRAELDVEVVRIADAVAARLRGQGLRGRTITVKVRYGDFRTITRSRSTNLPTDTGPVIAGLAATLLDGVDLAGGVRLFGITASQLRGADTCAGEQMRMDFADPPAVPAGKRPPSTGPAQPVTAEAWSAAGDALNEVRRRFGDHAVGPAALLGVDGLRLKRQGDTQWGPLVPGDEGARGSDP